jgi:peptide/nickel transport system ATP-binding protein/oligopeptide transport system ATP-binding protein
MRKSLDAPVEPLRYLHEFSGGQRQRIGIERTLALLSKLIVADVPLSALDVCIQAQVVNLLKGSAKRARADLRGDRARPVGGQAHQRPCRVMYLGKIVKKAPPGELYARPMHPYTVALLSAVRCPSRRTTSRGRASAGSWIRLTGDVPNPINPAPASRFHTRCWKAGEIAAPPSRH